MSRQSHAYLKYLLKIAVSCYIAVLLCSALFVSPLTSLTNYGHTHPDGSVVHLHSVQAILGSSLLGLAVTVVWLDPTHQFEHYEPSLQFTLKTTPSTNSIRAPPTFTQF